MPILIENQSLKKNQLLNYIFDSKKRIGYYNHVKITGDKHSQWVDGEELKEVKLSLKKI